MIGTALRLGGGLITLPLALRTMTQAEMGLYYTFLGITGLATLLDFGFAPTISRNAAYAMGGAAKFSPRGLPPALESDEPNWVLLGSLLRAVQRWYRTLAGLLALLLLSFGSWFVSRQIQQASLPFSLIWCWVLFCITSSFGFLTSYWLDLLMGIGSVRSCARIGLLSQSIGLLILIGGLIAGMGLWAYAFSMLISSLIGRTLFKFAFLRDTHIPPSLVSDVSFENVMGDLWPMAWRQGAVMLGSYLIQRGNTLTCSAKLGLVETGSYGLSLNLINIVFQVASIPMMVAWPLVGRLRMQGKLDEVRSVFYLRVYGGLIFGALGVTGIALCGETALRFLGSHTALLPASTLLLLGAVLWLENHHSFYGSLVLSENENPFLLPAILSGVAIFGLGWWSAGKWGALGLIAIQGGVQLVWNNWWTVKRGMSGLKK